MDKPYFREFFKPAFNEPILIEGLPGLGNVGKIAANLLIKFCGAKLFAELYAPFFPDFVTVGSDGICRLPACEFYAASMEKNDFIILTGDYQLSFDDVVAHYELCSSILDFVEKRGCRLIVAMGGTSPRKDDAHVYVAATSPRLAAEFAEKGASIYGKGRIIGATGLLLGLAKERGLDGVCILGVTSGLKADRGAGFSVFKFLMRILEKHGKEGL